MRLGTWSTVATLVAALVLGAIVTDVEAGSKTKKRRVVIDPGIKTHQLKQLERQLNSTQHRAVRNNVRDEIRARRQTDVVTRWLVEQPAVNQLLGLGIGGITVGPKSRRNHSSRGHGGHR